MKVTKPSGEEPKIKPRRDKNKRKKIEKKDIECFVCRKKGHFARQCPQRKQNKENKENKSDRESGSSRQVVFIALCVQTRVRQMDKVKSNTVSTRG